MYSPKDLLKYVKFITLRRQGKNLIEDANNIPEKDWIKVDLKNKKRKFNKFKMYESENTLLRTNFKVRQVIFKNPMNYSLMNFLLGV